MTGRPRKSRRGLSLLETALALVVMVFVIQGIVDLGAQRLHRHLEASTARQLSRWANAAVMYAQAEYGEIQNAMQGQATVSISWTDLETFGVPGAVPTPGPVTAMRTSADVLAWCPEDPLPVAPDYCDDFWLIVASAPPAWEVRTPRLGPKTSGIGVFGALDAGGTWRAGILRGHDISIDLTRIPAAVRPDDGSVAALRIVKWDTQIDPWIFRTDATQGGTRMDLDELNGPGMDLDLGGKGPNNVAEVAADRLRADEIRVSGVYDVVGGITLAAPIEFDEILANDVTVNGVIKFEDLVLENADPGDPGAAVGSDSALSGRKLDVETSAIVDTLQVNTLEAERLTVVGTVLRTPELRGFDVRINDLRMPAGSTATVRNLEGDRGQVSACSGCTYR